MARERESAASLRKCSTFPLLDQRAGSAFSEDFASLPFAAMVPPQYKCSRARRGLDQTGRDPSWVMRVASGLGPSLKSLDASDERVPLRLSGEAVSARGTVSAGIALSARGTVSAGIALSAILAV